MASQAPASSSPAATPRSEGVGFEKTDGSHVTGETWQTHTWDHFPKMALLSLLGALIAMALAIVVLALAEDSLVSDWPLAPTVYLSIISTLTNTFLRFSFYEGADLFWWTSLLSSSGVPLSELHHIWDLSHNVFSLVNFQNQKHLHLRLTSFLVLLLAVNGPLLQRAVTVEQETRDYVLDNSELAIRRQPMWNLTSSEVMRSGDQGWAWFTDGTYHQEFADAVLESQQRRPLVLSSPACAANATCETSVVIAAFAWSCEHEEKSLRNVSTIYYPPQAGRTSFKGCAYTGYGKDNSTTTINATQNDAGGCGEIETHLQLRTDRTWPDPSHYAELFQIAETSSAPWLAEGLPPAVWQYTSYVRGDANSDTLSVHQCEVSTAFVELPIRITNRNEVEIIRQAATEEEFPIHQKIVESIPAPLDGFNDILIPGFSQEAGDLYTGAIVFDNYMATMDYYGVGSRQYVNASSIVRKKHETALFKNTEVDVLTFSCYEPLRDVADFLQDLSLRYALKTIPETDERMKELESVFDILEDSGWGEDLRAKALPLMTVPVSRTQNATLLEKRTVVVYRAHYVYTGVATGVTYLATIMTALLLRHVFTSHGRAFTMSPLEIAKAFNAPLLDSMGSNSTGKKLAGELKGITVRYGEACSHGREGDLSPWLPGETETLAPRRHTKAPYNGSRLIEDDERTRLLIGEENQVSNPREGRRYM